MCSDVIFITFDGLLTQPDTFNHRNHDEQLQRSEIMEQKQSNSAATLRGPMNTVRTTAEKKSKLCQVKKKKNSHLKFGVGRNLIKMTMLVVTDLKLEIRHGWTWAKPTLG